MLKPEGVFHFVEHGHSPDTAVARWQERLEPLNKRVFGGCHLSRKIDEHIARAGFVIEQLDTYYTKGAPKPFGYTFEGRARNGERKPPPTRHRSGFAGDNLLDDAEPESICVFHSEAERFDVIERVPQ